VSASIGLNLLQRLRHDAAPLVWFADKPDRDTALTLAAFALIPLANSAKYLWPFSRNIVDWVALNFILLWLLPLVILARRNPPDREWGAAKPTATQWAVTLGAVVFIGAFFGYRWSGPHLPAGSAAFLIFQFAVQASEVFFFFGFFQPRLEKAYGVLGGVIAAAFAYALFQITSTDPTDAYRAFLWIAFGFFAAAFYATVPRLSTMYVFMIAISLVNQSAELQKGQVQLIFAIDSALFGAVSLVMYAVSLLPVFLLKKLSARRRRQVLRTAVFFAVLGIGGWLVFMPLRSAVHLNHEPFSLLQKLLAPAPGPR